MAGQDGIASGPRVQYKLVYVERKDPIGAPASCMAGGEVPPTAPDDVIPVEPCFAQDLLVQDRHVVRRGDGPGAAEQGEGDRGPAAVAAEAGG